MIFMEELNNIYFYNSEIGEYKVCSDEKTVNPNRFHSDEELIYSKDEKNCSDLNQLSKL